MQEYDVLLRVCAGCLQQVLAISIRQVNLFTAALLAMASEPAKGKGKMKGGKLAVPSDAWRRDVERQDRERQRVEALRQEAEKGKGKGANKGQEQNARSDSDSNSVNSDISTISTSSLRTWRVPPNARAVTNDQLDRRVIRKL